jgi:DNA polymerase III epsilon subunit-like protein
MKALVFDTETTGLIKNKLQHIDSQPFIIELFGVSLDDEGNELGTIDHLFDPGFKVSEEITRITGITPQMLVGKPKFKQHAEEVKAFIEDHDCVVAHNLSYDKAMIDFEMRRAGLTVDWPELICTVESTEHIKGFRLNLNALHELLFGEPFTGAHRAEVDVRALASCFGKLKLTGVI